MTVKPTIPIARAAAAAGLVACAALIAPCAFADAADAPVATVRTTQVSRAPIGATVRAYGVVGAASGSVQTVNVPYVARVIRWRVTPGQRVRRGAPLAELAADPSAVLAATQARTAVTLAQGELARTQSLYDQRLATQSQLAAAQKALEDARAALAAQNLLGVRAGNTSIASPIDGVVIQLQATPGDQVQPGAPLLQLGREDARVNVSLGVEPADAVKLRPGDRVTLHGLSSALADSALTGAVVAVGAALDPQSQLVTVGASVPTAQSAFIPGTRVVADIATTPSQHWVVPRDAVLKDDRGSYVFQVDAAHKAHRVAVRVSVEDGDRYGVDGNLDPARALVTVGNAELDDGMAVNEQRGRAR